MKRNLTARKLLFIKLQTFETRFDNNENAYENSKGLRLSNRIKKLIVNL